VLRIGIGEAEDLSACDASAGCARPLLAEPPIRKRRRLDHSKARVFTGRVAGESPCAIRGVIVHDDDLESRIRRRERGPHAPADVPRLISCRDDHRNERRIRWWFVGFIPEFPRVAGSPDEGDRNESPR
jgi:hypothetical protein